MLFDLKTNPAHHITHMAAALAEALGYVVPAAEALAVARPLYNRKGCRPFVEYDGQTKSGRRKVDCWSYLRNA